MDGIQLYLWGVAWLTCMQNVGARADAWRVFNKMPSGNVVTWIVMILVHVKILQTMAEGTGTTVASEAGACATKFC